MMRSLALALVAVAVCVSGRAWGQVVPVVPAVLPPGVKIDPDGHIGARQQETTDELAAQRLRVKALAQAGAGVGQPGTDGMTYVSLTKVLSEARRITEEKKELPESLRYVVGLFLKGVPVLAVAKECGVSKTAVYRRLKKAIDMLSNSTGREPPR